MSKALNRYKHIHLTGIKGVGMTALACCFQDLGIEISGSDIKEEFVTDAILSKRHISWTVNFNSQNIPKKTNLLVYTAAHSGRKNLEVQAALKRKIPVLSQAQALAELTKTKKTISICGVGGKTTTAAMTATILERLNHHPSFAIGVACFNKDQFPGRFNRQGQYFIAEADEYFDSVPQAQAKFLYQQPQIIVCTNLAYDHPDVYRDFSATKQAFLSFFTKLPQDGLLVINQDNQDLVNLVTKNRPQLAGCVQSFGFSPAADWQIKNLNKINHQVEFTLQKHQLSQSVTLSVPGKLNCLNAAAALIVAVYLGLDLRLAAAALTEFSGSRRRFELVAQSEHWSIYDDYAHHPTEIQATLKAARYCFPDHQLIAIFQPHTYSRTKALFNDFSRSFTLADLVIITDIYASAREAKDNTVSSRQLALAIQKHQPAVHYWKTNQILALLPPKIKKNTIIGDYIRHSQAIIQRHYPSRPNSLILTLGAGDIYQLGPRLAQKLASNDSH